MKNNLFIILLILFISSTVFAESINNTPLFEKNYLQIDPAYLNYQTVRASNSRYNQDNIQFITSRPSILFHFNIDNYILTSFISIDPTVNISQGSFAAGKLFNSSFELGLYSLINHTETNEGEGSTENSIVYTKFLLGPYLAAYPYVSQDSYLKTYGRVAYQYSKFKTITNGAHNDVSDQYGINLNLGLQYSTKLSKNIYFSPNANLTYFAVDDFGGKNTTLNGYELQIMPVSFQVLL